MLAQVSYGGRRPGHKTSGGPKGTTKSSGFGEGFEGREGVFPVEVEFLVEEGLLGIGQGGLRRWRMRPSLRGREVVTKQ